MKIILINPPNPDPPPSYYGPHYGLSLLGAVLERAGHAVTGRDLDQWSGAEALAGLPGLVRSEAPDLVGLSCQSSSRATVLAMADEIKRTSPKTLVVVGGPWATLEPGFVLGRCRADFVAVGDGEETLLELVEALEEGRPAACVPGLAFRAAKAVRRTKARGPFLDVDSLPHPAFHLFDAAHELRVRRQPEAEALKSPDSAAGRRCIAVRSTLMVLGSRGCVYRCVFCPMSYYRGPVRRHSPEYFTDMVASLARTYKLRQMVFGDNYFTLDRDWVVDVSERLIKRKLSLEWICMTRPDSVSPKLLRKMGEAGCREIAYGLESGSPKVQERIGKRMRLDRVGPALEATREAGISSTLMLMVGNPGEDRATVRETAEFCSRLEPDRVLVHATKVYPGTTLHDAALRQGVIPRGFYDRAGHEAPPYTGEWSLSELKALADMLQPRTTYLAAGAGCVNGCCGLRAPSLGKPAGPCGAQAFDKLLTLASLRTERVVLGGGEPFLRRDIPGLLRQALVLQMHGLWFYTTARPLASGQPGMEALWEALRDSLKLDVCRGIVVPLFSHEAGAHDKRALVEGALLQARAGLLRWKKAGGSAHAWLRLDQENISSLAEWVPWLADHGVSRASFLFGSSPSGWGRTPCKDLPLMAEAGRAIRKVRSLAGKLGVSVSCFGIPECVLPDDKVPNEESRCVFDELLAPKGEPVSLSNLRRKSLKAKPHACGECSRNKACEGVWKDYLLLRGEGEFHAL